MAGVIVESIIRSPQGRWFSSGHPTEEQQEAAVKVTTARMQEMVGEITEDYPDVDVEVDVSYGSPLDVLVARSEELDLLMLEVHASFPTYSGRRADSGRPHPRQVPGRGSSGRGTPTGRERPARMRTVEGRLGRLWIRPISP